VEEKDPVHSSSTDPLSPWAKRGLLAAVIFFHIGGGWALTLIQPDRLTIGEPNAMEVSFVEAEQPPAPEPPPPEEQPPEPPQLESMIEPPPPDLPPPEFPVPPPPPPKPVAKPPPPRPQKQAKPNPAAPPSTAPAAPGPPKVVGENQVEWLNRPAVVYPVKSRRRGDQGKTLLRVLIDPGGRPSQVLIDKSSGHATLDEAAVSGVKAARLKPFVENGVPQQIWVIVPINFVLQ